MTGSQATQRLGVAIVAALAATFVVTGPLAAQSRDSADVVAVVARFHAALASGDSTAALSLLADDVAILEGGGIETLKDYRSGHIRGDMAYARALPSQRTVTSVRLRGDAAWVVSSSTTQGVYRERQVNSAGAELMVLARDGGVWRIRAIHWSSRERRS